MYSKDAVGPLVGKHLGKSIGVGNSLGTSICHERKDALAVGGSGFGQLLFGIAHGCNLGMRMCHAEDRIIAHMLPTTQLTQHGMTV